MTRALPNGYGHLVTLLFKDENWMVDAACRGAVDDHGNYDAFFQKSDNTNQVKVLQTKYDQCADCPVAWECFEYADRIEATGGVWGGMDPEPRRKMVNQYGSARKARGAHAKYLRELRTRRDQKVALMEKRLA